MHAYHARTVKHRATTCGLMACGGLHRCVRPLYPTRARAVTTCDVALTQLLTWWWTRTTMACPCFTTFRGRVTRPRLSWVNSYDTHYPASWHRLTPRRPDAGPSSKGGSKRNTDGQEEDDGADDLHFNSHRLGWQH